jgi:hypothetical protein
MQGFLFSRPQPADDIERWLGETMLPRKAPWIGRVGDEDGGTDLLRIASGRV